MNKVYIHTAYNDVDATPIYIGDLPESWAELSYNQISTIAHLIYMKAPMDDIKLTLCLMFIPKKKLRSIPEDSIVLAIYPLLNWLASPYTITKQLKPSLRVGISTYYAPKSELDNCTIEEVDQIERSLFMYFTENDAQYLWEFVACLYRPKKIKNYFRSVDPAGDVRISFNEHTVSYYAKKLSRHLHVSHAYAALMWYRACWNDIVAKYPLVFSSGSSNKANNEMPTYLPLIRKVAEKGTYGNIKDVEKLNIYTILFELEESIKEHENNKT